jgi:hypothetical protein
MNPEKLERRLPGPRPDPFPRLGALVGLKS